MNNINTIRNSVTFLANRFECRPIQYNEESWPFYVDDILEQLQEQVLKLVEDKGAEYFIHLDDAKIIQHHLFNISYFKLERIAYGLDYNLELRNKICVVNEENYSTLFQYLVVLPKFGDEGLERENHGFGYHIHYVILKKKTQNRTNVLFTFDPIEISLNMHSLYWEYHGSGLNKDPSLFGVRRTNAIYDTSCSFLNNIPKGEFRTPTHKKQLFWPR